MTRRDLERSILQPLLPNKARGLPLVHGGTQGELALGGPQARQTCSWTACAHRAGGQKPHSS
jgi:hypothetical protein